MGNRRMQIKMPTGYSEELLKQTISKESGIKEFTWQIEMKSLDARKKGNIHWLLRVVIDSPEISGEIAAETEPLVIPFRKRNKKIVVTGSGPAGFFAAFVLQKAGFRTIILERGAEVGKREEGIIQFERTGKFHPQANYSFGEGGAGTFSDGKLTSRSKHISREKAFILDSYIKAGAPEEIRYMAFPHLGSDILKRIVFNLRKEYQGLGGEIFFETQLTDMMVRENLVSEAVSDPGTSVTADYFIMATGHSSYETFRMLMDKGVLFRTKNFAIGTRAEHRQEIINRAQWGVEHLPGVKAAEYRLTSEADRNHPVYSFCMCPGGMVVPAATYQHQNIVNGMSNYHRNGRYANAACVAGIHPDQLAGKKVTPAGVLDWLEELEHSFFEFSGGYHAPFCSVKDFLNEKVPEKVPGTSYPLGIIPAPLWKMLPSMVTRSLKDGLLDFSRKLKGYDEGILLGLESKTSSPIQVIREKNGLCSGFGNLYMAGEGSGFSGGIISSAADGIRIAMQIISKES